MNNRFNNHQHMNKAQLLNLCSDMGSFLLIDWNVSANVLKSFENHFKITCHYDDDRGIKYMIFKNHNSLTQ